MMLMKKIDNNTLQVTNLPNTYSPIYHVSLPNPAYSSPSPAQAARDDEPEVMCRMIDVPGHIDGKYIEPLLKGHFSTGTTIPDELRSPATVSKRIWFLLDSAHVPTYQKYLFLVSILVGMQCSCMDWQLPTYYHDYLINNNV